MDHLLIEGVLVTPQKRILNPKGDILHAMKRSGPGYVGFGEAYFSTVRAGLIKGWKRHRHATLNLLVPVGAIRFVICDDRDVRQESSVAGRFIDVTLGGENHARLTVPPGLWMAFKGMNEELNLLLNISNEEHDPAEADNIDLDAIPFVW